jgi:hypothetical protein
LLLTGTKKQENKSQKNRINKLKSEHKKAPEGGLHDLADTLVGEQQAYFAQDQELQHL